MMQGEMSSLARGGTMTLRRGVAAPQLEIQPDSAVRISLDSRIAPPPPALGVAWLRKAVRRQVLSRLEKVERGRIVLEEGHERLCFGTPGKSCSLQARVRVHDGSFYRAIALRGSLGASESYMRGEWDCDDLTVLIRILALNSHLIDQFESGISRLSGPLLRLGHRLRKNTLAGSRRNIAAHYDLGNDFYLLFLDQSMTYSCAIFRDRDSTLEEAAWAKNEHVCRKLDLKPDDHLLEIGSGWGALAIHAASRFGCRVTTTTISKEQFKTARHRVRQAGLADRVSVLQQDYRRLQGAYDKLVSIEMIEAVGHQYYDAFFGRCSRLLKPDGLMLLQAITVPAQRYRQAQRSVDFIKKYIFPGGCLPSVDAICETLSRVTDLRLTHLEDLTPHYARTLRCWRERFWANIDQVRALGYSQEFIRMWHFYLCYCEAGFEERYNGDVQMLFSKPHCRRQPVLALEAQ